MIIRPATLEDAPRVLELAMRFLETTRYGAILGRANPLTMAPLFEMCLVRGVILVAVRDYDIPDPFGAPADRLQGEEIIGFVAALALPHPITSRLYCDEVAWFVDPQHRNGLAGPKLLRSLEDWTTTKSIDVVKMVAPIEDDGRSPVGDFLKRMGYVPVETAFQRTLKRS